MSNFNFCFSPTGGTKKVADNFKAAWGEDFMDIDLMKNTMPLEVLDINENDFCIFAVPSYGGRIPKPLVERFGVLSGEGAKAVLIAVFGNRAIDDTLVEMYDLLTEAGFKCIAGIEAVAEHSMARNFGKGRPDESDKADITKFAHTIKEGIKEGTVTDTPDLPGNRPYKEFAGALAKPSTSGCVRCGLCVDQCPTGAIPRDMPMRTDKTKCITCMRCVEICPAKARKINKLEVIGITHYLKPLCKDRKPNKLYL